MEKLTAYLEIAKTLSELSPCPRAKVGAVIIRPDRWSPLSSAFNGTPRKSEKKLCGGDCCERDAQKIPSGRDVQIGCHHAETNAIANAAYEGVSLKGSWLICTAPPCLMCSKMIHHAGIEKVFFTNLLPTRWTYSDGVDYLKENGLEVVEI